ncbi:SDR family oxidoreductase [Variovorax gossypii]|uniref:SDR family oxidoreductase n=1 Tax=Variovorax gossypii TaxID=1679495 RepID=A0A3S0IFD3_9BURK|nr:SDR family NAD(P)-dependent oxidoreductase [Variovorax gossypii]MDP9605643.1 3-oxoacyl-[acyl-carrier protein] reductase [Variovorax paradoxus]RTQ35378.1 SDR family oxidoreductase [Variovorax gossypii]
MAKPALLPLSGRVAFVTGAGQGLGAAIARGLSEAGARVALADIELANAEAVAAEIGGLALQLDVRDEAAFSGCFDRAVAHFGAVDIMVNNAARTPTTSLWDITPGEWDDVLAINLRGSFFGCRIAGRHMRERGEGRIVNLSSMAGQQASSATGVHYAASKAGLLALTRSFAQELAPHGVTVNALAPAAIGSPALEAMEPARRQALQAGIPLGRFGLAEEVAAAVVYLASPAAAFITGATLDLNGGRFMR